MDWFRAMLYDPSQSTLMSEQTASVGCWLLSAICSIWLMVTKLV